MITDAPACRPFFVRNRTDGTLLKCTAERRVHAASSAATVEFLQPQRVAGKVRATQAASLTALNGTLYFLQAGEIEAEAFFAEFAWKLDFDEFGFGFHFALEDDTVSEDVMVNAVAGFEALFF